MAKNYRYPGSRSFEEKDAPLFFGREEEKRDLFNLIHVEKIVSVFSRSGIGKTSLILAGLLPMLENTSFSPILIRFNDLKYSPLEQFRLQYGEKMKEKIDESLTIWEIVKQYTPIKQGKVAQPLLILDQFEELFTLHSAEKRQPFLDEFADLGNGRIPNVVKQRIRNAIVNNSSISDTELVEMERQPRINIIIAIRSDFLHFLDDVSKQVPNVLRTRIQLAALKPEQATEAILNPASLSSPDYECPTFKFDEAAIKNILTHLQNSRQEIESFQLQILCRFIEEKRIKEKTTIAVTSDFYGGKTGIQTVLNNFYHSRIAELRKDTQAIARKMIEEELITESERRRSVDENDLIRKYALPLAVLNTLVEGRLLRKEPRLDSFYYEISHDTLVQPILISYKSRKAAEEATQQAAELARLKVEKEKQAAALAEEKRRADEQAELKEKAEQAQIEAQKAQYKAEQAQKRATLFAWGAGVLAVLAVVVGIWAWNSANEAERQREVADSTKYEAIEAQKKESISAKNAKAAQKRDSISRVNAEDEKCKAEEAAYYAAKSDTNAQRSAKQALIEKNRAEESLKKFHQAAYDAMKNKVKAYESIGDAAIANQQQKLVEYYYQQNKQYISKK